MTGGILLHEPFGHEDEPEVLRPFRDEATDDLAPPGFDIHVDVEDEPGYAGDGEEEGKRVVVDEPAGVGGEGAAGREGPAGLALREVFSGEDGDEDAGPIGNGVAEEGAGMGGGIGSGVGNEDEENDEAGGEAEGVACEERGLFGWGHGGNCAGRPW